MHTRFLGVLDIYKRLILKWILYKWGMRMWTGPGFMWLRI
jgi:hypothetical protein